MLELPPGKTENVNEAKIDLKLHGCVNDLCVEWTEKRDRAGLT